MELTQGIVMMIAAAILAVVVMVLSAPANKRKFGIWLVASADASDQRSRFFKTRHQELRAEHLPKPMKVYEIETSSAVREIR